MQKVNTEVNREEWPVSPATVNAFYLPLENKVVIPAALLQPPHFSGHAVHPARNFGAIGTTIGHEMTHGFDSNGRLFDRFGNKRSWWTLSTEREFNTRADCFKNVYTNFTMTVESGEIKNVDGELTLEENIADNGGVSVAWDAYREYMMRHKPQTTGVTLDEGDQMFFLAFAHSYCRKTRDENMRYRLKWDAHSPPRWRVNGVVINNPDFAKVFKCGDNTPMNPIDKCKIW